MSTHTGAERLTLWVFFFDNFKNNQRSTMYVTRPIFFVIDMIVPKRFQPEMYGISGGSSGARLTGRPIRCSSFFFIPPRKGFKKYTKIRVYY